MFLVVVVVVLVVRLLLLLLLLLAIPMLLLPLVVATACMIRTRPCRRVSTEVAEVPRQGAITVVVVAVAVVADQEEIMEQLRLAIVTVLITTEPLQQCHSGHPDLSLLAVGENQQTVASRGTSHRVDRATEAHVVVMTFGGVVAEEAEAIGVVALVGLVRTTATTTTTTTHLAKVVVDMLEVGA